MRVQFQVFQKDGRLLVYTCGSLALATLKSKHLFGRIATLISFCSNIQTAKGFATPRNLYGFTRQASATVVDTEDENTNFNAGVNANPFPSPILKVNTQKGRSSVSERPRLESQQVTSSEEGVLHTGIQYLLTDEVYKKLEVVPFAHCVTYQIDDTSIDLNNLWVNCFVKIEYERTGFHPVVKKFNLSFGIEQKHRTAEEEKIKPITTIGIIGYPKTGKTSVVDVLFRNSSARVAPPAITDTGYLYAYPFENIKLPNFNQETSFMVLDTRGYYFDAADAHDMTLLDKFLKGLRHGTDFKKSMSLDNLPQEPKNRPTHIILTVSARLLWSPVAVPWFYSLISTPQGSIQDDKINQFVNLYKTVKRKLADERYGGKQEMSQCRIWVLVSHMDMIKPAEQQSAENNIRSALNKGGIPKGNFLVFGSKVCSWCESDLKKKEEEIANFLNGVQDYQDKLYQENMPDGWLHIEEKYCLEAEAGCKHPFTAETKAEFMDMFACIARDEQMPDS